MANVGNWIGELTTTVGTGAITLTGIISAGFTTFQNGVGDGTCWYAIIDGDNREAGIGTLSGSTLTRTTVYATLASGVYDDSAPAALTLTGSAQVYCTFNKNAFEAFEADIAARVSGPASAVDNRIATFDLTTGKLIQDSGTLVSDLLALAGGTMAGDVNLASNGITETLTATAANTFAAGEAGILVAAGTVTLANATSEASTKGQLVIATAAIAGGAAGVFMYFGQLTGLSGLTAGSVYYVGTTAGAITATAPTGSSQFVRVVGHARSTTELSVRPGETWIELVA